MNDERHVDWSGLKYYDSLIKKHVNSLIADLQQQTASVEEITSLNNRLEQILVLATTNQANIQELFNENTENEKNLDILFESDKVNSENIRELQTRVEYIATKEELATVEGTVKTILDDITELEKIVAQDHITLEELRIAFAKLDLNNYVTKDELDELIPDVDGFATKDELEKAVEDLATEEEVKGLIEEIATVQELLEEKANVEDIPDVSGFATKTELEEAIASIEHPTVDLTGYATEDYVKAAIDAIPDPDLSDYAKKSDIPSIEGLATEDYVKAAIDAIPEVDLTGYATETYVKNAIAEAELAGDSSDIDLSGYATKDDLKAVENKIPSIDGLATEKYVDEKVSGIVIPDVSGFATKDELQEAIDSIEHPTVDLTGYATEEYVDDAIANIPPVDLNGYATEQWVTDQEFAKKSDVPSIDGLATESYVDEQIKNIDIPEVDLTPYATKEEVAAVEAKIPSVDGFLTEIPAEYITEDELKAELENIEHPTVDLSDYYTKAEVDGLIPDVSNFATKDELPKVPTKVSELENDAGYLTEHQSLDNYYNKAQTDAAISAAVESIVIPEVDLEPYATKEFVESGYANKDEFNRVQQQSANNEVKILAIDSELVDINSKLETIPTKVSDLENDAGYLTEHQSLKGYATEEFVIEKILEAELADTDFNAELYYTKTEVDAKIPSIEGLATEEFVTQEIAKIPQPDLSDYAKKSDIPSVDGLASETYVDDKVASIKVPTATSELTNDSGFLTEHQDISHLATKSELEEAINNIEHPTPDLTGYATEDWVNNQGFAKTADIPTDYVTSDDLTTATAGLASEDYVDQKVAEIEVPDVSNFVTKETVDTLLATKADDVPFTTNKVVNNAVGEFKVGDSVQGLTVAQILTKMLGLVEYVEPDEPTSVVEQIIANRLPMYSIKGMTLSEVPFALYSYSSEEADLDREESGFYQITNTSGEVVESGYQDVQIINGDAYYLFALPNIVDFESMVTVQFYDEVQHKWSDANSNEFQVTNDRSYIEEVCSEDPQMYINAADPNLYTVWMLEEAPNGKHIRFIIKE